MLRSTCILCLIFRAAVASDAADWPMLYQSTHRNNVSDAIHLPTEFDLKTNQNIKWSAELGSVSYGSPVLAHGQLYVGTNNGRGYLEPFPPTVDLGCLLCFRQSDGRFLWQYSAAKLPTGHAHDWPLQGIVSVPCIEDDRMWFVSNQGKVVCLDTRGFYDGEDDGQAHWTSSHTLIFQVPVDLGKVKSEYDQLRTQTLRKLLGVMLGARISKINVDEISGDWRFESQKYKRTLRTWHADSRHHVTFSDGRIHRISSNGSQTEEKSMPSVLTTGLSDGIVNETLREVFRTQGIEISTKNQIETIHSGKSWRLHGLRHGQERKIDLSLREGLLTADYTRPARAQKIHEADVVWSYDMMGELGTWQHNLATCAPVIYGDLVFINTSNGVDQSHQHITAPEAPSFIALHKRTGELIWQDNPAGRNILHGQWSCAAVGVFDGVPQVIFPAGDGWVYAYRADMWQAGKPILLWKFDGNPKTSEWRLGGRARRNNIIAPPTIADGKVYIIMGQDPEHGDGEGDLWCLDPTKRGDLSAELAVDVAGTLLPPRRLLAVDEEQGEQAIPNPNSGVIWHFEHHDINQDGDIDFEEQIHRSLSSVVVHDGLLYAGDLGGIVFCLDATNGKLNWSYDAFAPIWGTPLVADGKVFIGDEDGELMIFEHSRKRNLISELLLEDSIRSTPIAIEQTLYLSTNKTLYSISQ